MSFTHYKQLNAMDCGPTCLRMVAKKYGRHYNAETLRQKTGFSKRGTSLLGISEAAENIGFRTRGAQISFDKLQMVPLPAILHWSSNHFVVLTDINKRKATIADPALGILTYKKGEFLQYWISNKAAYAGGIGTVLLLEPTPAFFESESEKEERVTWSLLTRHLTPGKWQLMQVLMSLLTGMLLQLILPFLSQSMVDTGINTGNLQFITIVLLAQLALTLGSTINEFIRMRLQMRISNIINISLLSDFWIKVTKLPVSYFTSHHTGDTLQRIGDNKIVQSFLTSQALSMLISICSFFVYAVILSLYSIPLFVVFFTGNLLYFGWIRLFLRFRRKMNYAGFHLSSKMNNTTLQLIQGMQEIKLNNAEQLKRWDWENLQVQQFKLNYKNLNYDQIQNIGALFISQGKDLILSFMVAQMVVQGQLTLGTMIAVQFIISQLSGPVSHLVNLAQNMQDVKISLERLNDIYKIEDEEPAGKTFITQLPHNKSINLSRVSFTYKGDGNKPVLEDISLLIPQGKVTAIVGISGSGKTTLLKLLLKIYDQYNGELKVGGADLKHIGHSFWRNQCGAVLQDGYIFNDTIARNIAVGDEYIDEDRLLHSCQMANILSYIETLPNGFNTQLGSEGVGISQGQKQRLLIARAIYKDPQYLFFDEATNSLDANNEKIIVKNLNEIFKGRTVVVVAHRLSTVKDADKIVVLHNGKIIEEGTHTELTSIRGAYYELVKNQLELGN
ncbi:ABC transporter ATP-binding protein [Niastella vici]|uniref:ABC transporter ATP-binding protein n=1 Tax=Niastella vici TaxID=1703345 RepID=A0A1V9FHD3_9BACT|nr:peptidase domain-containing ABC transporter [Niastella vici]OQP57764.1 ABC transporter ATP-binding protein [Niastella vici]